MKRYDIIEESMTIEARQSDESLTTVEVDHIMLDIVFHDDLLTSDRSSVCSTVDGQYVLYQDFLEDESDGRLFATKEELGRFLWERRECFDLCLLDRLGMLEFCEPPRAVQIDAIGDLLDVSLPERRPVPPRVSGEKAK